MPGQSETVLVDRSYSQLDETGETCGSLKSVHRQGSFILVESANLSKSNFAKLKPKLIYFPSTCRVNLLIAANSVRSFGNADAGLTGHLNAIQLSPLCLDHTRI